ncbi:MAG: GNAT family N-acetyltransferase [Candidatus ainarchaeum sp.]|nr:GNAT family N-acetyltransferase [Candidatus ainarchaeum sp.]
MASLTIKQANRENLKDLDFIRECKLPKLHEKRFIFQDKGKSNYYIFFKDGIPVGHVDVIFKSRIKYHKCPVLQDLYVKKSERKKGFGKNILNQVGKKLKPMGYKYMGLDVEKKEPGLRKFYESCGFKVYGEPHRQIWIEKDNNNKKISAIIFHLGLKL